MENNATNWRQYHCYSKFVRGDLEKRDGIGKDMNSNELRL